MNGDWYPEGSIGSWNTSYEQPRVNYRRAAMYHDIRTYIFNNTIDAELAGIPEFLGGSKATGPLEVAARLEGYGNRALSWRAPHACKTGAEQAILAELQGIYTTYFGANSLISGRNRNSSCERPNPGRHTRHYRWRQHYTSVPEV
jgi:hypothetical protein